MPPCHSSTGTQHEVYVRAHAYIQVMASTTAVETDAHGASACLVPRSSSWAQVTSTFDGERTLRTMRWTHFTLPVIDLAGSISFFTEVCGLTLVRDRRTEGGRTVWVGPRPVPGTDPEFVVVLYEGEVREPLDHFGFQCDSQQEVAELAARASRTGALVSGPTDAGGSVGYYAIVREPSGHLVEFTFGQPLRGLRQWHLTGHSTGCVHSDV